MSALRERRLSCPIAGEDPDSVPSPIRQALVHRMLRKKVVLLSDLVNTHEGVPGQAIAFVECFPGSISLRSPAPTRIQRLP